MRKILVLVSVIGIAFFSCKKDSKPVLNSQVIGTWSLSSFTDPMDTQVPVATAAQYPCIAGDKMTFKSDGTLSLAAFGICYISPPGNFQNVSTMSRANDLTGTWSSSGSSVSTTVQDKTSNQTFKDSYTLTNDNGQLQLKLVDSTSLGTLTYVFVKQ